MSKVNIPQGYRPPLTGYEMQRAIEFIKSNFQLNLCRALNLRRVSAPLFVDENSGLNDNLNGFERPVTFDIPDVGANGQVVHSLAKWKRLALQRYGFRAGKGLSLIHIWGWGRPPWPGLSPTAPRPLLSIFPPPAA